MTENREQKDLNSEVGLWPVGAIRAYAPEGIRNAENLRIADRIRIDRIPSFDIRPASFH